MAEEARALEGLAARRAALGARVEDLGRRIRELGTLPADAFDKYKGKKANVGGGGTTLCGLGKRSLGTTVRSTAAGGLENMLYTMHGTARCTVLVCCAIPWQQLA